MNLFEAVKASINTREAAQVYGIDVNAKLFDLRLYDAARKLASDFHLAPDKPLPAAIRRKKKRKTKPQQLRENEQLCFSVLNEYRRLLQDWKKRYAPQAPEDVLDERFVEACHRLPWAEYQSVEAGGIHRPVAPAM